MKRTNSYQINIENPCEEQWNDLRKNDCGRFCQLCQKTVVDFTMMSDREIIQYIENHKEERICGRVVNSDLNRVLINYEMIPKKTWKFRLMSMLLFLSSLIGRNSYSQKIKSPQKIHKSENKKSNRNLDSIVPIESILIKSEVLPDSVRFFQKRNVTDEILLNNGLQGFMGGICIQKVSHKKRKKSKS